jgi:hypothetical protein
MAKWREGISGLSNQRPNGRISLELYDTNLKLANVMKDPQYRRYVHFVAAVFN